jgi:hypothetical protein
MSPFPKSIIRLSKIKSLSLKSFHQEVVKRIYKLKERRNIQTIIKKDSKIVLVCKEAIKDAMNITIESIIINIPIITTPTTAIKEEDSILNILEKFKILTIIRKANTIISTKLKDEIGSQLQTFRQQRENYRRLE